MLAKARSKVAFYAVVAVTLLASGCDDQGESGPAGSAAGTGASDDAAPAAGPSTPEATIRDLFAAGIARDGKTACALVTRRGRSLIDSPSIRGAGNKACVENVETYTDDEIDVELVRVTPVSQSRRAASVEVVLVSGEERERTTIELIKADGRWLADEEEGVEVK